jgi:hypothetical protein
VDRGGARGGAGVGVWGVGWLAGDINLIGFAVGVDVEAC